MKNLIIWGYPRKDIDKQKENNIPVNRLIGISEHFNPKKTHPDFDYDWVRGGIHDKIVPMPKEVIICIKQIKSISFDFLPFIGKFYLIYKNLLDFIVNEGFDYNFEKSLALLVNTKGIPLTEEPFYLMRIIRWKIKEEIIYPDLHGKNDGFSLDAFSKSDKNVFLTQNENYIGTLIFNELLKDELLSRFKNPFLYTLTEWKTHS
ncbi:Imm43 family immunity protein [Eikenella corrodens]|uniref:Immunity protein 43 domain-containing protein n=1 Tax=Eikenella corrodens TaxID=539 RepID=A0A3S9SGN2_EIKCO|nr:hypothetical protein [Eikenella corrodens]AZR58691.1 hypothetical protein ELB75_00710 [Eikenella corrodens]